MGSTNPSQVCRCHQRAFFIPGIFSIAWRAIVPQKVPRSAISSLTKKLDLPNQIAEILISILLL